MKALELFITAPGSFSASVWIFEVLWRITHFRPMSHFLQNAIFWKQVARCGREWNGWKEQTILRRLNPHYCPKRINGSENLEYEK